MLIKNLTPGQADALRVARAEMVAARLRVNMLVETLDPIKYNENARLWEVAKHLNEAIANLDMGMQGFLKPGGRGY